MLEMRPERWMFFTACLALAAPVASAQAPVTASPGDLNAALVTSSNCPTFSWGPAAGAQAYELVVYEVAGKEDAELVLESLIAGGATSWTPGNESCLSRGRDYAWAVRAVHDSAPGPWSVPRHFAVALGPSAEELASALDVVHRYLASQGVERSRSSPRSGSEALSTSSEPNLPAVESLASLGSAVAAIRAEQPDKTGDTAGVIGVVNSPDGAGILAANLDFAGGPDLILDGTAQGAADTVVTESSLEVGGSTFDIGNAGGTLDLRLDGVSLVTTATDQDTTYSAGTGLSLVDTTFAADTSILQSRVNGVCPSGSSIRVINADGSVACEIDDDSNTTYSAGAGLELAGTTFQVATSGIATAMLNNGAVSNAKISSVSASKVTAGTFAGSAYNANGIWRITACPTGYSAVGGTNGNLCWSGWRSPQNRQNAERDCFDEGAHMCNYSEFYHAWAGGTNPFAQVSDAIGDRVGDDLVLCFDNTTEITDFEGTCSKNTGLWYRCCMGRGR